MRVNQAFNSTFHSKKLGKPGLNRVKQAYESFSTFGGNHSSMNTINEPTYYM